MSANLDVLIDELYALPLERFVPERGVLAKQLRADGRRAEAAQVAALDKPSIAGWAVNQVVRAQRTAAASLWEAGDAVLGVQADLVDGRASGADLREAIEAQRRTLGPLADAARGLMTGSGRFLAESHVQAVVETLHAAAIDASAREQVASARLVKPLRLTGLEAALAGGGGAPRRRTEPAEADDDPSEAGRRRDERAARALREEAQRTLVRAERARDEARRRVSDAASLRDEAVSVLERARAEAAAAEHALEAAETRLTTAHAELESAEDAADRARGALD